jgi:hydrogenase maturation protease HycI
MSKLSWQESLRANLQNQLKTNSAPRVAVLGIGHELRGDDAVGLWLAARLKSLAAGCDRLLAVEAGPAPENFTGTLRKFKPDLVVLADAAFMDADAGAIGWLSWQDASGFSASTHTLPLHLLATYLTAELDCEVALIGIQPAQLTIGAALTPEVQQAAEEISKVFIEAMSLSLSDLLV